MIDVDVQMTRERFERFESFIPRLRLVTRGGFRRDNSVVRPGCLARTPGRSALEAWKNLGIPSIIEVLEAIRFVSDWRLLIHELGRAVWKVGSWAMEVIV